MTEIQKDEFELLIMFVENETDSYRKQRYWYEKHEPKKEEVIKDTSEYIKRLILLREKLHDAKGRKEE